VTGAPGLRVVAIEPVGVRDLVDITTGTGDFVAGGVISHNCFARPTHEYLNFGPGRDFEKEIVVKVNAPERLRADLAKRARTPAWGDTVALGTNTDPYQWVESKYRLMPGIWEAIRDARVPGSVLTKSPLLLRDQALMLEVQANAGFEAALSVPSLDTKAWRTTEPHTPHPRARLAAVAELNRIGIPTAVLAAPLMPGINDSPAQIEALLAACTEAGAIAVRGMGLHLRGSTRDVFLEWLGDARPDLVELYAELYRHGPHLPRAEADRLAKLVQVGERWGDRVVRTEAPTRRSRFAPGSRALSGGPAEAPTPTDRRPGTRGGAPKVPPEDQLSLF
jgi:DNA repair photolyase